MELVVCLPCKQELYEECLRPKEHNGALYPCAKWLLFEGEKDTEKNPVGRPVKDPSEVTDPLSTGRKRAKMAAPIFEGQVCAWAGLRFAGGGSRPIVGCNGNQIVEAKKNDDVPDGMYRGERHHGPDKNVLNNSVGVNLHVVCSMCHERWHQLNNPSYSGESEDRKNAGKSYFPESPYWTHDANTLATEEEVTLSLTWWKIRAEQRPPYPFTLPEKAPIEPQQKNSPLVDEFVL